MHLRPRKLLTGRHGAGQPIRARSAPTVAVALGAAALLAGCGAGDVVAQSPAAQQVPTRASCPTPKAAPASDSGAGDLVRSNEAQRADFTIEHMAGATPQLLALTDAIAVMDVAFRQPAVAVKRGLTDAPQFTEARPSRPRLTALRGAASDQWAVIRPAQLALVRPIKGSVPDCLQLDVPGGSTKFFAQTNDQFPLTFAAGDRVLVLLSTDDGKSAPYATGIYRADKDGYLTIPFGDHERVDLNTWNPTIPDPPPISTFGEDAASGGEDADTPSLPAGPTPVVETPVPVAPGPTS